METLPDIMVEFRDQFSSVGVHSLIPQNPRCQFEY